ncbi:hypothetical protein ACFFWC_15660 [Plantactinospora siamensis]|uniref:Uncharacterized protein n=1 Tax=Plantactinospora siamensis TaxID=555372 RepID=A0ABV6NVU2_9ACTN
MTEADHAAGAAAGRNGAAGRSPAAASPNDAADLADQLRELAGSDPAAVRQVVAEVLAALDRASGGALRDQLPGALDRAGGAEEPR